MEGCKIRGRTIIVSDMKTVAQCKEGKLIESSYSTVEDKKWELAKRKD